jgi:hypothetical protein
VKLTIAGFTLPDKAVESYQCSKGLAKKRLEEFEDSLD